MATATTSGVPLIKANGSVVRQEELGNGTANFEKVITSGINEEPKDPVAERLAQIYKRLEQIDAYSAEARAAAILAVSLLS